MLKSTGTYRCCFVSKISLWKKNVEFLSHEIFLGYFFLHTIFFAVAKCYLYYSGKKGRRNLMKCNEIVCMLQSIVRFFDAEKSKGASSFRLLQIITKHFSIAKLWHSDTTTQRHNVFKWYGSTSSSKKLNKKTADDIFYVLEFSIAVRFIHILLYGMETFVMLYTAKILMLHCIRFTIWKFEIVVFVSGQLNQLVFCYSIYTYLSHTIWSPFLPRFFHVSHSIKSTSPSPPVCPVRLRVKSNMMWFLLFVLFWTVDKNN